MPPSSRPAADHTRPWYAEVTRYQWLVLVIASAGWIFDVYEGQIFNITSTPMLEEILGGKEEISKYRDFFLSLFLLGGTLGGLAFGSLADRYGRRPIMIVTILVYSLFSGLTALADSLWQVAALRFLVAMGVGGEWAVAASLVAEVFPARARAQASGIFHASSVLGTWMAALVGMLVAAQWRYGYLVGIAPALLILWVRASVREPQRWEAQRRQANTVPMGRFRDLLLDPRWRYRALFAMGLATVGLATFWSVTVAGQELARGVLLRSGVATEIAARRATFAYGIVQTAGGGLGLLAFGPLAARFGRKATFVAYHLLALAIVPLTAYGPQTYAQLLCVLPLFGFLTLGMHAGYAIYFPELFPTHLRATGTSFCFNGGRLLAAPMLVFSGWLKDRPQTDMRLATSCLALLFLLGALIMIALPETRARELED